MPVTKTAKRALRSSLRKKRLNDLLKKNLEIALRSAKKSKSEKAVKKALSAVDIASKKNIIHKNKAARIKSSLSKIPKPAKTTKRPSNK